MPSGWSGNWSESGRGNSGRGRWEESDWGQDTKGRGSSKGGNDRSREHHSRRNGYDNGYQADSTYGRSDRDSWPDDTPLQGASRRSKDEVIVNGRPPSSGGSVASAGLSGLECHLADLEKQCEKALEKVNEKQGEKFDLIFGILSELQRRQARLEDSISKLMVNNGGSTSSACEASGNCGSGCVPMQGCGGCSGCSGCGENCYNYGNCGGCNQGVWTAVGVVNMDGQQVGYCGGCRGGMAMQGQPMMQQPYNMVADQQGMGMQSQAMAQQQLDSCKRQGQSDSDSKRSRNPQQPPSPGQDCPARNRKGDGQNEKFEKFHPETSGSKNHGWIPQRPPVSPSAGSQDTSVNNSPHGAESSWTKVRVWKVVNLPADETEVLPVVCRAEPFAPGCGKTPPEEWVVRWLQNGDTVQQVGHSKKVKGHMIMPVKFLREDNDINEISGSGFDEVEDGWVTRRQVNGGISWFDDLSSAKEA